MVNSGVAGDPEQRTSRPSVGACDAGIGEAIGPAAGQRAERQIKLPRCADQTSEQQAGAHRRHAKLDDKKREADLDQIFRLVHLHRVRKQAQK